MNENILPDSSVYPQAQNAISNHDAASGGQITLASFRHQPAVHNRPGSMLSCDETHAGCIFSFEVRARKSRLSYTHETSLHLYSPADAKLAGLQISVSFWAENLFRVTLTGPRPYADPFAGIPEMGRMLVGKMDKVTVSKKETDTEWLFSTSCVCVHIDKATGRISAEYADGTPVFAQKRSEFYAADIFDYAVAELEGDYACHEALELDSDEVIWGLGERFDGIVRNGKTVDFWNKDAVGTTSRRTYVNIPFFLSSKGYGLFLNSGAQTQWEIGTLDTGALQFSIWEPQMDYFVIAGRTPKDILKGYCTLTGFSQLPPLWSFGLWMSRNSYTSWDVTDSIARQLRLHDIPCDVLHLDTAWFKEDWNCDLQFSQERFPDPQAHLAAYQKDGFHISLWQYNFNPPRDNNTHYQEAVENGYLAKDENGLPYRLPSRCEGSWVDDRIVDFSNPEAREWYGAKIRKLMEMGAGAIKTDFGEGIPEDAHYDRIEGKYFHNTYSLLYNATVFNACKAANGSNLVWARSGTAGSQRYPIHWGGDSQCTFDALAATLRAALCIGASGIPFFSHDIGGFIGEPDDELYIRWAQLGLFSSHSRCHGSGDTTHREPWTFSDEACTIFRTYDKLRYSLMPYIYEQAKSCTQTGLPMMRALFLEYPEDRNTWRLDDEYLFGSQLLIAPVLKPLRQSRIRPVYLPKGIWHDYFTKQTYESHGRWIEREVDLKTMPIFVKAGTTLSYCSADRTLSDGMGEIVRTEVW